MKQKQSAFRRNVPLDYVFSFLRNFDITSAIWVLFMIYRGMSLVEVGIAEGVFHLASLLFEVPTGAAADLLGRKRVMILGRLLSAVSAITMLHSHTLLQFSLSFALSALSYNMNSGTEDALVYDSMKAVGLQKDYIKVSARLNLIIEIAQGSATFLGGVLSESSYLLCYSVDIALALLSLIPLLFMKEPPVEKEAAIPKRQSATETATPQDSILTHFKTVLSILQNNPAVIRILLYYPTVTAFAAALYFYGQEFFAEYGFNRIQISIVMVCGSILSCFSALAVDKLLQRFPVALKYIISLTMACSIILCALPLLPVSVFFFILANAANAMIYPIESSSLNALIPSAQRATIISIDSMCYSLAMIVLFPLCGAVATHIGLHRTFLGLGITEFILMLLILKHRSVKS